MMSHTQTPLSLRKGGAAFWTPDSAAPVPFSPSALELKGRLLKFLYIVQAFLLAGTVCFYFQGSVEDTADHDIAGDTSQPIGETLRPVWGPMDKCYPGTTQRRRVKSEKKEAAAAGTPKAMGATGGLSDAAEEEPGVRSEDAGAVRSPAEEAASPILAGKEVAGTPGCERLPGWRERRTGPGDHTAPEEALARLVPSL
ncbi:uncharacterized protein LOC119060177 isoform X2 [Artibeus jamaicensis]|uniref:uncharacterized protein LOC119060177 isoform X2 n=1 Tax=Artibeus jamaicensis TaxID=9417 RepID=UPI00235A9724|nr:uncharacterized protein LOC119060177 isoform X2 [Artibeus jamaicensis]